MCKVCERKCYTSGTGNNIDSVEKEGVVDLKDKFPGDDIFYICGHCFMDIGNQFMQICIIKESDMQSGGAILQMIKDGYNKLQAQRNEKSK